MGNCYGGYFVFQTDSNLSMPLNEWGDFLAGASSPVAFLWLVFGYMQQGEELRENTQALAQQKQEYSKSTQLSAYLTLITYENNEVKFLNELGDQYIDGAMKARERAKSHTKRKSNRCWQSSKLFLIERISQHYSLIIINIGLVVLYSSNTI